jgi:hypothetical protein
MGRFCSDVMSITVFRENFMPRKLNIAVPAALILSALILSACATTPETPPVSQPAPLEVVAETPVAPVAVPAQDVVAATPSFVAEPAPVQVAPKAKKKVAKAKPAPAKAEPPAPAPVEVPAPVVKVEPPVTEPAPPVYVAPPAREIAEAGFLEKYWLWLLALVIAITVMIFWWWKSREN